MFVPKPRVFIGSDSESRPLVNSLSKHLAQVADVVKWWESYSFKPTYSTLASLQFAAREHDFGVFVFSPTDVRKSRGTTSMVPRDNVIFEMGLFLGTLGPDRTFGLTVNGKSKNKPISLPSDLAGINFPRIDNAKSTSHKKSIAVASELLGGRIAQLGFFNNRLPVIREYEFNTSKRQFEIVLDGMELQKWEEVLRGRRFVAVALKQNKKVHFYDDSNCIFGVSRDISKFGGDLFLESGDCRSLQIGKGDVAIACLLLLPTNYRRKKAMTVGDLMSNGAQLIARVGQEIR